jgi:hypothetical protein
MKIILSLILTITSTIAAAENFPIQVVRDKNELPVAILVAMLSREPVVFQIDTGSPKNILFPQGHSQVDYDKRLASVGAPYNISSDEFLFDSRNRLWINIGGEHEKFNELFASSIGAPDRTGVIGLLGIAFFKDKNININFKENTIEISKSSILSKYKKNNNNNIIDHINSERILINVCSDNCEEMIFDTGVVFADIVSFVKKEQFEAYSSIAGRRKLWLPGFSGGAICTSPVSDGGLIKIGNMYHSNLTQSICMFISMADIVPSHKVLGIRRLIEEGRTLTVDYSNNYVSF